MYCVLRYQCCWSVCVCVWVYETEEKSVKLVTIASDPENAVIWIVLQHFHADKMKYYMLSAFLCQTNKCLNLSWWPCVWRSLEKIMCSTTSKLHRLMSFLLPLNTLKANVNEEYDGFPLQWNVTSEKWSS